MVFLRLLSSAFLLLWVLPTPAFAFNLTLTIFATNQNADGSPLVDLSHYEVCVDSQPIPDDRGMADCSLHIPSPVPNPQLNDTVISPALTCASSVCYYRVAGVDFAKNKSVLSNEVSAEILKPGSVVISINTISP